MKNTKIVAGVFMVFLLFVQTAAFSQNKPRPQAEIDACNKTIRDAEPKIAAYERAAKTETRAVNLAKLQEAAFKALKNVLDAWGTHASLPAHGILTMGSSPKVRELNVTPGIFPDELTEKLINLYNRYGNAYITHEKRLGSKEVKW